MRASMRSTPSGDRSGNSPPPSRNGALRAIRDTWRGKLTRALRRSSAYRRTRHRTINRQCSSIEVEERRARSLHKPQSRVERYPKPYHIDHDFEQNWHFLITRRGITISTTGAARPLLGGPVIIAKLQSREAAPTVRDVATISRDDFA